MSRCLPVVLVYLMLACRLAAADQPALPAYASVLTAESDRLRLYEQPRWLALLHYKENTFAPGGISTATSPDFFLAIAGSHDARAELKATIEAFFSSVAGDEHPQCRFPARYAWLKQELDFDSSELPERSCNRFREWSEAIDPVSLTLVFPASFLNNPASAFGHTFLRFDQKLGGEDLGIVSYAANFAAATHDESAVLYALKGMFGGYSGYYSVAPYYEKVRQYNDIENRDMWEYRLAFSPEDLRFALRHLWELKGVAFQYYYFDENCSYHLLSLLNAVRPDWQLFSQVPPWVIPIDTVRAVLDASRALVVVDYRPAAATALKTRAEAVSGTVRAGAIELAAGRLKTDELLHSETSKEEQAQTLDLAYDVINYRLLSAPGPDAKNQKLAFQMLRARSTLAALPPAAVLPPPAGRPDNGHASARLRLGFGHEAEESFYEIGIRPAYHDLLDPPSGYVEGAEIVFLDTAMRHYETEAPELERLVPLEVRSLSPRSVFVAPLSWRVSLGMERERVTSSNRRGVYATSAGAGVCYELGKELVGYGLLAAEAQASSVFDPDYALGAGPEGGLLVCPDCRWGAELRAIGERFGLGDAHDRYRVELGQRLELTRNLAARITLSRRLDYEFYYNQAMLSLDWFF